MLLTERAGTKDDEDDDSQIPEARADAIEIAQ
jgi:hypothetical protein